MHINKFYETSIPIFNKTAVNGTVHFKQQSVNNKLLCCHCRCSTSL